jgi:hypothetical protein
MDRRKQYRWDTLLTRRLQLAALEARMIPIPATLALEHGDEPQADGETDPEQDTDGCADDKCADAPGTANATSHLRSLGAWARYPWSVRLPCLW